ncbi:type III-B CRISPR module RAMP protein Cmr4 [Thiorhodococcus minor]|uniref:Type III-B CRISPR module RAMP protein Cmr4 n=1 Tax=Thiorhodococcus minor TaxID=57489 RepID=A0A6M0K670_9GAMM|nr:type III-B CRISPR module RAMP protein Cmr4 [Thiorhodococcus minor]
MFEATRLVFYYAVSPVHMGAGSAIGAIDNPIQREVHTQHPIFAGSGIKGALRHHFNRRWSGERGKNGQSLVSRIFGPPTNASDHAGAFSVSDAQLAVLPVRSLKGAFVYATCPLALGRLKRFAELAGVPVDWSVENVQAQQALTASDSAVSSGSVILESFEFSRAEGDCVKIAAWLADNALPAAPSHKFFADKLRTDLIVLSDTDFAHFARHGMAVEPHVRINDESGTADDGGLFYTENLPPESILVGLAQASLERFKKTGEETGPARLDADAILSHIFEGAGSDRPGIANKALQIGGDATTGRGLVIVRPVGEDTGA